MTLVCGARDEAHNGAVVLRDVIAAAARASPRGAARAGRGAGLA